MQLQNVRKASIIFKIKCECKMYNNLNFFLITYIVLSKVNALSQQEKNSWTINFKKWWHVVYNFVSHNRLKKRTQQNLSCNYGQL